MPLTKVVILNWNGLAHLQTFLPSVVASASDGISVVVADNGSTDGSVVWVERNFPLVEIIRLDSNYGYAGGYNRALAAPQMTGADYFVLLNSDVETPLGWCEPLVRRMEADNNVAAVMPKILSYGDKHTFEYAGASGGFIDGLGYPFCRGRILSRVEKDEGQYDDSRDVFWASGACLMFRADIWRELGGLDEAFFAHMEEIDLCWRAQLKGYRIMVEPGSEVYHLGAGTLAVNDPRKTYLNFRNNLAMLYKNLSHQNLLCVMLTRMMLDGCSALVYLLSCRWRLFKAVFRAHVDFWKWRPQLKKKRSVVQSGRKATLSNIYKGSIVLRYIFGRKRFSNMM